MATPGEPYPLNNSPFPNAPFRRPLAECVFSHVFFTPNGAGSVITCAPTLAAHAAHPSFWDPGWQLKILKMQHRLCTTTESPHLPPKCCSTHPWHLKMGRFGSLVASLLTKNRDSGSLLRTHYLLCFSAKTTNLRHLWAMWKPAL